ncbi:MAG: hypothetical protein FJ399_08935, partial [Verrucomicrobia bacterium]|nr:hypothetical protein [Verrucomicrobiota bacterium]
MTEPRVSHDDRTQVIFQPGTHVFGRYTLTAKVGEGGMGVVWRAHDEKLKRDVALKFLPEQVRRDPEALRDLMEETRRCLDLTHPNIVRVYDFIEDGTAAAIAMEYVPGQSLSALKAARPTRCFDAADLAPLVRQLCAALEYAHGQAKIVHRDLKPANLLVTDEGVLKIADFGIARSLRETHTRQTGEPRGATGTLMFMGPEQLLNRSAQPTDDVYSLGATLYDLLTGKPPFYAGDLITQIRELPPAPLAAHRAELGNSGAAIPPEWERTILACLAKRAEDRPVSAAVVLAMLGGGTEASARPVRLKTPGPTPKSVPAKPNRAEPKARWPLWLGLGALGVATVVALVFWPRSAEPAKPATTSAPATAVVVPPKAEKQESTIVTPPPATRVQEPAEPALPKFVEIGMTEAQVFRLKGQPHSKLSAGLTSVYHWPDLSVTMKEGKVESFRGIDVQARRADEGARARAEAAKRQAQTTPTRSQRENVVPSATRGSGSQYPAQNPLAG